MEFNRFSGFGKREAAEAAVTRRATNTRLKPGVNENELCVFELARMTRQILIESQN